MPLRSRTLTFLLICFPYFLNLGVSSIWDANEALYAETSREMLESGDFLHPQFNGQPRIQKPPLTYWVIAASYAALGVSEFSTRFPSALAVAGLFLFIILGLGRISAACRAAAVYKVDPEAGLPVNGVNGFTTETALLAAAILATVPRFFIVARRLPIDCLFTVFLTVSLLLVMWGSCRPWMPGRSAVNIRIWLAAGFLAGLAVLTKGPVAIVIEVSIAALFALAEKKWPWRNYLIWAGAVVLVVFPYYAVLAARGESGAIWSFLFKENLGRYTTLVFGPSRSSFYYFRILFADAFPWSWFLPAAVYYFHQVRKAHGGLIPGGRMTRFCAIWFTVIFVLFSISRNKQEYYILPAYPAMAILLAWYFQGGSARALTSLKITARMLATMFFLLAGSLLWLSAVFHIGVAGWVIPALLLAAASFLWFRPEPPALAAGTLALLLLLAMVDVCVTFLPALEFLRPARQLAQQISGRLGRGDRAGYFRYTSPSMAFYLRRPILELYENDELQQAMAEPGRLFLLMEAQTYENLPQNLKSQLSIMNTAVRIPTRAADFFNFTRSRELPRLLVVAKEE